MLALGSCGTELAQIIVTEFWKTTHMGTLEIIRIL